MTDFLYHSKYNYISLIAFRDEASKQVIIAGVERPPTDQSTKDIFVFHALVYSIAAKYKVTKLKSVAASKYESISHGYEYSFDELTDFVNSIELVWKEEAPSIVLQQSVMRISRHNVHNFLVRPNFQAAIAKYPIISQMLLQYEVFRHKCLEVFCGNASNASYAQAARIGSGSRTVRLSIPSSQKRTAG